MSAKLTERVTFLLSPDELQTLSKIAVKRRRTISDTLRQLISEAWAAIIEGEKKSLDKPFGESYKVIPVGAGDGSSDG